MDEAPSSDQPSESESQTAEKAKKRKTVHRRDLRAEGQDPKEALVQSMTAITGTDAKSLSPLYATIDNMVGQLYSSPPPAEAQARVEFIWEGVRITLFQDGTAIFQEEVASHKPTRADPRDEGP